MRHPSARLLVSGLLLAAACSAGESAPGEPIGTFAFEATLDATDLPGRCAFEGAPPRISFDGSLSRDPATGKAWLQIDGTLREGDLACAAFTLDLPKLPDGSTRLVPRRLPACTCDLGFSERLEGFLVPSLGPACEPPGDETPGAATCPRLDENGELAWDTCGGACGTLTESVRPDAPCKCVVDGVETQAPENCSFVYRFEARRIGG